MKTFFLSLCLFLLNHPLLSASVPSNEKVFEIPYNKRHHTFAKALQLMEERGVKIIVETGTTRGINLPDIYAGDGGSTIIFGDWATRNNAIMYSVDIDPTSFSNGAPFLAAYKDHLVTVCSDSIEFLVNFPDPIDMLYLDSFDFDNNNPYPSQEHHLKEVIAAYPKLTEDSIILIDDCGLSHGGKGKLVIEYLEERGWKIVERGYQVLLVRG